MSYMSFVRGMSVTVAIVLIAAVGFAGVSGAATSSKKQRIAIDAIIPWHLTGATFKLVPLTSGAIHPDSGQVVFSPGGTSTRGVRDGQEYERIRDSITFAGRNGTLVIAEDNYIVSSGEGVSVFTGTWRLVRGTGTYKGLSGSGRTAGLMAQRYAPFPNRWEGAATAP